VADSADDVDDAAARRVASARGNRRLHRVRNRSQSPAGAVAGRGAPARAPHVRIAGDIQGELSGSAGAAGAGAPAAGRPDCASPNGKDARLHGRGDRHAGARPRPDERRHEPGLRALYAALAFAVGERTREIAVRLALGASRADVARLVFRRGMAIVLLGIIAGVMACVIAGPFLAHMLYGVTPRDPLAITAGPVVLIAVAALAISLPARRAMKQSPIIALRAE
jgi:hypothetical protein